MGDATLNGTDSSLGTTPVSVKEKLSRALMKPVFMHEFADDDLVRTIDFGDIATGTLVEHVFSISNDTSHPIAITDVDRSCSCHAPELRVGQIIPVGMGIRFRFGVTAVLPGPTKFRLGISTDSTDPSHAQFQYEMVANVYQVARMSLVAAPGNFPHSEVQ